MAELRAQFQNAQRSTALGNGGHQDIAGNFGLSQVHPGNSNIGCNHNRDNRGSNENIAPANTGAMDRSNHVISSESSVASGNTSATSSKLPVNKRDQDSTSNSGGGDEKKEEDEGDNGSAQCAQRQDSNQGVIISAPQCDTQRTMAIAAAPSSNDNNASNMNPAIDNSNSSENRAPMVLQLNTPPHPVAEFLFQLTKMLTDNNSEYIEWSNASIYVHDPPGLEKNILPKYFRHSNYSSFQRQMNYFGFRKIAGKGKMAPCSYVNEAAKEDISSLLFIKRKKTGVSGTAARFIQQQNRMNNAMNAGMGLMSGADCMGGGNLMGMGGGAIMNGIGAMGGMGNNFGMGMGSMGNVGVLGMGNMPGMGAMSGMNGMGQISQFPGLAGCMTGNSSLALNNFQGANGAVSNMYGQTNPKMSSMQESALLREQQMLAQLQQAHQSATGSTPMVGTGGGLAAGNNFMPQKFPGSAPGGALLTTDQGNVYSADWNNFTPSASAGGAGFVQSSSSSGFGGHFQQGAPISGKENRAESAANLRTLINQKISLYSNSPPAGANASGSLGVGGAGMSMGGGGAGINDPSGGFNLGTVAPMASAGVMSTQAPSTTSGFQGYDPASYEFLQRNTMPGIPNMDHFMQRNGSGTVAGNPFGFGGPQSFTN